MPVTALVVFGLGALIVVPNFLPAKPSGQLTACMSNCKNIGVALEMYASDNGGSFPPSLKPYLIPNYLKTIPTCPAAGHDTYSDSYRWHGQPENYTFYCSGLNHDASLQFRFPGDHSNYPQYCNELGLIDRPPNPSPTP